MTSSLPDINEFEIQKHIETQTPLAIMSLLGQQLGQETNSTMRINELIIIHSRFPPN